MINKSERVEVVRNIWALQSNLMDEYIRLGRLTDYPVDLNSRPGQEAVRKVMHFLTEELVEMGNVLYHPDFFEEAADFLHFLFELYIQVFHSPEELLYYLEEAEDKAQSYLSRDKKEQEWMYGIIHAIHMGSNTLKNKPWRVTESPTDVEKLKTSIASAWVVFIGFIYSMGIPMDVVYKEYEIKNQKNFKRIKDNY